MLTSSGIAILAIALLSCVYVKSWSKWITFRVYSLYYLIVLDAFFTRNGFSIYESFNWSFFSPENRITPGLENFFRIVSVVFCITLLYRWLHTRNGSSQMAK
jgi:energy-coupling factor transporter transmembrane protein EcfT